MCYFTIVPTRKGDNKVCEDKETDGEPKEFMVSRNFVVFIVY